MKKFNQIVLLAIACLGMLLSCKKDKDGIDTEDLFAYLPPGTSAYNEQNASAVIVAGKVVASSQLAFPVLLTRATSANIEVTAKIDTSLISAYNKANASTYPALADGIFAMANGGKVTVKKDQSESADSIKVQVADATKLKAGNNTYLVPVVLSMASNNVPISGSRQIMYLKIAFTVATVSITDVDGLSTVDIFLNRNGSTTTGTNAVNIKAVLNIALEQLINVGIAENQSLVDAFNKKNNTTYKPFPAGGYILAKDNTTIAAKATSAADNMQVQLPDLSLFATGTDYLLPLQIKENTAAGTPPADANKNVVYVHVSILITNIDAANAAPTGTTLSRTGWTVKASGSYNGNDISRILDGNNATAWDSDGKMPATVTIDMGASSAIKGFAIVPSYEFRSDNFINMDVLSSNDGNVWKLEGKYVGTTTSSSSSAAKPDIKNVKFINPVTARYFRFNITKTTDGKYAGMAEVNAIQ